jgi:hypothetical protein
MGSSRNYKQKDYQLDLRMIAKQRGSHMITHTLNFEPINNELEFNFIICC